MQILVSQYEKIDPSDPTPIPVWFVVILIKKKLVWCAKHNCYLDSSILGGSFQHSKISVSPGPGEGGDDALCASSSNHGWRCATLSNRWICSPSLRGSSAWLTSCVFIGSCSSHARTSDMWQVMTCAIKALRNFWVALVLEDIEGHAIVNFWTMGLSSEVCQLRS